MCQVGVAKRNRNKPSTSKKPRIFNSSHFRGADQRVGLIGASYRKVRLASNWGAGQPGKPGETGLLNLAKVAQAAVA